MNLLLFLFFSFNSFAQDCILQNISFNKNNFHTKYSGYGKVLIENEKILLHPKKSVLGNETHAALVLYNKNLESFKVSLNYRVNPLRKNPNSWETFWLFFNYQVKENKETNYFIFKNNGIELGKAWGEIEQIFIVTKDSPKLEYNKFYNLEITKNKEKLEVFVNNVKVLTSNEKDILKLFSHEGQIGLYSEDAIVEILNFKICK